VQDITPNTVNISWQAPGNASGNFHTDPRNNVSSYMLFLTDKTTEKTSRNTTSSLVYTFLGLEEFRNYSVQVLSVNFYGTLSNLSAPLLATTSQAGESVVNR